MPSAQDGRVWGFNLGPGLGNQDKLTNSQPMYANTYTLLGQDSSAQVLSGGASNASPKANYLWYLLGIVLLLALLKYASEHEKSGMEPHLAGIGVWNFFVIGIMALLFLVAAKTVSSKWLTGIPGLHDIVQAA